jgi:hypothetical protein
MRATCALSAADKPGPIFQPLKIQGKRPVGNAPVTAPSQSQEVFLEASLWPETRRGQVELEALLPKVAICT